MPVGIESSAGVQQRYVLVESLPRYLSAFDGLVIPDAVPAPFRRAALTQTAARREILAYFQERQLPIHDHFDLEIGSHGLAGVP